jgi:hypothetical protein
MAEHECKQEAIFHDIKENIEKTVKNLKQTVQWVLGISVAFILLLVVGVTETRFRQSTIEEQVRKINDDYTPLFIMRGITGSNDRLIDVIRSLPDSTKDDRRYLDAIKSRDDFQREILEMASSAKRSGGSSSPGSANSQ